VRRARYLLAVGLAAAAPAGVAFAAVSMSDATKVSVDMKEWGVAPKPSSAKAGAVTFSVKNTGHLAHEFIVLQTSTPAAKLKVKGTVAVLSGKVVGKTAQFGAAQKVTLTVNLKPGHYVLLCNLPAHYAAGQRTDFTAH
jgi:uncharacterized cupredoxin-like copper-binding protein